MLYLKDRPRLMFFEGKSLVSQLIKLRTWSKYSHVAHLLPDGTVIEAWTGGVRHVNPETSHTPGTPVDVYTYTGPCRNEQDMALLRTRIRNCLGMPYDYRAILGFLLRINIESKRRLFCSELVCDNFNKSHMPLLKNVSPFKVSPGVLSYSPHLTHTHSSILHPDN